MLRNYLFNSFVLCSIFKLYSVLFTMLKQSILLFCGLLLLLCYFKGNSKFDSDAEMAGRKILSAEFEVFGIVQGL
jgi:hypothetical protein